MIAIKSVAYLSSTRALAGSVVIVPQYAMAIMTSFLGAQITTTFFYGQSLGTYEQARQSDHQADPFRTAASIRSPVLKVIWDLSALTRSGLASENPLALGVMRTAVVRRV